MKSFKLKKMETVSNITKDIKIIIEKVPNEQIKVFNVNKRISDKSITLFDGINTIETEGSKIGELGKKIISRLFEIEGVEHVFLHLYSLTITKAKAFTWDELESDIKKVITFSIKEYIPDKNEINEVICAAEDLLKNK